MSACRGTSVGFGTLLQPADVWPSCPNLKQYPGLGLNVLMLLPSTGFVDLVWAETGLEERDEGDPCASKADICFCNLCICYLRSFMTLVSVWPQDAF